MEYEGIEATRRFIELFDGNLNEENACWRTFPDKDRGNGHNYTGTFEEVWPALESDQKQKHGLFRVVNLGGHKNKDITTVVAWFVDSDGVPLPDDWHLPPTFICQRGDRWHAYWLAELGVDADTREYRRIQKRLAAHYGTDPVICNLARVMRIPGTEHHKNFPHAPGYTLTDFEDPGRRYSPDQVEAGLPELEGRAGRASKRKDIGKEYDGEPDQGPHKMNAINWLRKRDIAVENTVQKGMNGNLWTYETACFLAEFALSADGIVGVMTTKDPRNGNKSWAERCQRPWDDDDELLQVAENAIEYMENPWGCRITGQKPSVGVADIPDDAPDEPEGHRAQIEREVKVYLAQHEGRTFELLDEDEQDKLEPLEYLIDETIPTEATVLVFGAQDSYKSFLMLDMMLSLAAARAWAGMGGDPTAGALAISQGAGEVVYVAGEGHTGIAKLRRPAWKKARGIEEKLPFHLLGSMPHFKSASDVAGLVMAIEEKGIKPAAIVVDTMARAMFGMNEDSAQDTGMLTGSCDFLREYFKCAVILIHHTGHTNQDRGRGSSAQQGNSEVHVQIEVLGELKCRMKVQKQKDGSKWSEWKYFKGEVVQLDNSKSSLVFNRVPPEKGQDERRKTSDRDRKDAAQSILEGTRGRPYTQGTLADAMVVHFHGSLDAETYAKEHTIFRKWIGQDETMTWLSQLGYARKTGDHRTAAWEIRAPFEVIEGGGGDDD